MQFHGGIMEPHCHLLQPLPTYSIMSAQGGLIDWTNHLLISGNRIDKRGKMESYFHFGGRFERKGIE
jgi:hypothetical protein